MVGCEQQALPLVKFCTIHEECLASLGLLEPKPETKSLEIYDHLKINIEQSAKGARVTITYDRSDHDIVKAVDNAVELYIKICKKLEEEKAKVDTWEDDEEKGT